MHRFVTLTKPYSGDKFNTLLTGTVPLHPSLAACHDKGDNIQPACVRDTTGTPQGGAKRDSVYRVVGTSFLSSKQSHHPKLTTAQT